MWKVLTKKHFATKLDDPHPAPGPDPGEELLPDFRDEALDKGLGGDLPVGQPKVVGPPIHRRYAVVLVDLDERGTDRSAAAEAMAIGRGGITAVAEATGLPRSSIQTGIKEL